MEDTEDIKQKKRDILYYDGLMKRMVEEQGTKAIDKPEYYDVKHDKLLLQYEIETSDEMKTFLKQQIQDCIDLKRKHLYPSSSAPQQCINPVESVETSPIFKHIELVNAVKDSKFDERGPFLNVNSPYVKQIYIRDAYKKLEVHSISLIKDVKAPFASIQLMGSPGLGKTYFSLYLVKILCDNNIPFIYDAKTADDKLTDPLFVQHGKITVVKEENIIEILESVTGLLYIVDGKSPILTLSSRPKVATILVCSPRTEYYKRFKKRISGDLKRPINMYYLPTWDIDELITANHTDYNEDTIERRYWICGGVARSVYSLDTESQLKTHIKRAIIDCDFERLRNFVDSEGTSDLVSHTLILFCVDDTLTTIRPFFATQYISEQLFRKFRIDIQNLLTGFFD